MKAALEAGLNRLWWQRPPRWPAWLLWPLSGVYELLRRLQAARRPPRTDLPVPVLVVGNCVVGGAGKTPTVIALVQALRARGHAPGVISRGHGRRGDAAVEVRPDDDVRRTGDEPLLLRRRCGAPVWVGADRVAAARALCAAHPEVDVLVADDGLQHTPLPQRAALVVFDERGAGNGLLLPAGPLRQPLPTRMPPHWRVLYNAARPSTPLPGPCAARHVARAWPLAAWHRGDAAQAQPLASLQGRPLLAAAGMAAPEKFFRALDQAGLRFDRLPLPDHHAFATLPWPPHHPDVLVTEKDAVKLAPERMGSTRVWVVPLDFQLPPGLVDDLIALLFPPRTAATAPTPP